VNPVDTTAAGDAFNGAFAMFLAQGREVENALSLANCVGALSTTRNGAQASMPTLEELKTLAGKLY
jgi:ribokinase